MTTTAQTSTSLERKIATYALAAGATLAATGSVDADVECQIIDREIQATTADGPATLDIDMDGDGTVDYAFLLDVGSDGETITALDGKDNVDGQPNQVKTDPASKNKKAKRFQEGDVVGLGPDAANGAFLDERFSCATSSPSHFVGVQFFRPVGGEGAGASEHFGFIGVCVEPATSTTTPARLIVRQAGFETTSSTPAIVGDCAELAIDAISGGGCQMGPGRSLVDLAPLGMLALGAAGLGALRRRRREHA